MKSGDYGKKIEKIREDIDQAMVAALSRMTKPGEVVVTAKIFCGDGGGISKARVGFSAEESIRLGG